MNKKDINHQIPSVAEVKRISAICNPIIRNLQITQCYHELSAILFKRTGVGSNWCTYATWASKQAGQTIRKEDLVRTLENVFNTSPIKKQALGNVTRSAQKIGAKEDSKEIQKTVWDKLHPAAVFDRTSTAIGKGNKKVFEEIGHEFVRFFLTCLNDTTFNAGTISEFCKELLPGDPPDGQRYLQQAFTHYYQSFYEQDAKKQAELLFLANIEIGFHEQTRLQPEIAEALDVSFVEPKKFTRRLIREVFPYYGYLTIIRLFFTRVLGRPSPFDAAINNLIAAVQQQIRFVITKHLMTIELPHNVLVRLGEDLRKEFPPLLIQINNPELLNLLGRIDPTPDSTQESSAVDWKNFSDRIHFITDMFRCYQDYDELFDPPFTPDQVADLKAGRLPNGKL